jgi:hypothetical protein
MRSKKDQLILAIPLHIWYTIVHQYMLCRCQDETDLVECSHRLVGATNLQLVPVCFVVPTLLVRTLYYAAVSMHTTQRLD